MFLLNAKRVDYDYYMVYTSLHNVTSIVRGGENMDYKLAFHKAYLGQQRISEVTRENIAQNSLDPARLVLLEETDHYWIIKVLTDGWSSEFLNVVYKDNFDMETIEIGAQ